MESLKIIKKKVDMGVRVNRILSCTDIKKSVFLSTKKLLSNARSLSFAFFGVCAKPPKTRGRAFFLSLVAPLKNSMTGTNPKRKLFFRSEGEFTPKRKGIYDAPWNPAAFLEKINGYASDRQSSNLRQNRFTASVPLNVKSEPIKIKSFFRIISLVDSKPDINDKNNSFLKLLKASSACLSRGWGLSNA